MTEYIFMHVIENGFMLFPPALTSSQYSSQISISYRLSFKIPSSPHLIPYDDTTMILFPHINAPKKVFFLRIFRVMHKPNIVIHNKS